MTIHLRANGKDSILQNAKKGEQFLRERFGVTKKIEVEAHSNLEGKALFEETARIRAEASKTPRQSSPPHRPPARLLPQELPAAHPRRRSRRARCSTGGRFRAGRCGWTNSISICSV
ncbi:MAG: hypothetical protein ACLUFI_12390 [Oscillospiraceae bacterium]